MKKRMQGKKVLLHLLIFFSFMSIALAIPQGPVFDYVSVSESPTGSATLEDNSSIMGGWIAVMNLNASQQNSHWKAYVGNVSGSLVLQDASNYSIFSWSITTISGEVYATRSASVNWSAIVCANSSQVDTEMVAMNHTQTYTPSDMINLTFSDTNNHTGFVSGPTTISANTCNYSTQTYVDGVAQTADHVFEETLLSDGSAFIYVSMIEQDEDSFHTGEKYDYQMLVAEKGEPEFYGSSTNYYFYVELI